jgi:hypothetical protein
VPRHQFQQAYREDPDDAPSLISCAMYFIVLVILGGAVMFLLITVFRGSA